MLNLTPRDLELITLGELIGDVTHVDSLARAVIDSRHIGTDDVFFAFKGEKVDGHAFLQAASDNGAALAVVEQRQSNIGLPQLVVDDCQKAMARIALHRRKQFSGVLMSMTGSCGKTTTKGMLVSILRQRGKTDATEGNLNNELGVPLTLMNMDASSDYFVVEMGAAERGDIRYLMQIAQPDITAITNIGTAHIGRFGSREAIAETKAEIFAELQEDHKAAINLDDAYASDWLELLADKKVHSLTFSQQYDTADLLARDIVSSFESIQFTLCYQEQTKAVKLPATGRHNVSNALCAAAMAILAGCSLDDVATGLAEFVPVAGRLAPLKGSWGGPLLDDSYNANPGSVQAAIDVLCQFDARRWLVLGDMAELGGYTESAHQDIGEYARSAGVDELVAFGEQSNHTLAGYFAASASTDKKTGRAFTDHDKLVAFLRQTLQPGDAVLVKGSRSSAMEKVVEPLLITKVSD
ncbi:UDP-N-acetylmuramoyl-tripeptide--D-alanyl-D-alanine ligase [BD1-7 clade bacterium]|uniref:UDP-N-acetylmuramoyl-tripeptide--D-alanyl-D-alanine ligase n=1 Tax=BD1-7 clade bacterium TaxID=2029982 RepID=A0A5S9N3K3_9GAMM|nr:UDP-N-acetylmuramoyl-tripeptide--D-alanyl-D-alanine ligase [BD1-7 clade bacterium]